MALQVWEVWVCGGGVGGCGTTCGSVGQGCGAAGRGVALQVGEEGSVGGGVGRQGGDRFGEKRMAR